MTSKPSTQDLVWLCIVLAGNTMRVGPMSREQASDAIEQWSSGAWSRLGKVSGTLQGDGLDEINQWGVLVSSVVGIYTQELEVDPNETLKRMVDVMKKKNQLPGDEWKETDEDIEE